MSMGGEYAREEEVKDFCIKIAKKIKEYGDHPDAVRALKELGTEILDGYENWPEIKMSKDRPEWFPEWFKKHRDLFQK